MTTDDGGDLFIRPHSRLTGSILWDGSDLAVSTVQSKKASVIYRFQVSGRNGKIVQEIPFKSLMKANAFWIQDGTLIGSTPHGEATDLWPYPSGGKPYGILNITGAPEDYAVSIAPSR